MASVDKSVPGGRRRSVTGDDLDALYALLKGTRYSNVVLDAKSALENSDHLAVVRLLEQVKEKHTERHTQTMRKVLSLRAEGTKESESRAKRLEKQEEKNVSAFTELDDIIGAMQRLMDRQQSAAAEAEVTARPPVSIVDDTADSETADSETADSDSLPANVLAAFAASADESERRRLLDRHFDMQVVGSAAHVVVGRLYWYLGKDHSELIRCTRLDGSSDPVVSLEKASDGKRFQAVSLNKFLELGRRERVFYCAAGTRSTDSTSVAGDDSVPDDSDTRNDDVTLDIGAFSQLLDAVNRTGLLRGAEQIAHVRDREFRLRDYQNAFQHIEILAGKFNAAASQRQQRLKREEYDIRAGKVKLSPKELQLKRAKETAETQLIERARNRFSRVLEGLRILLRA